MDSKRPQEELFNREEIEGSDDGIVVTNEHGPPPVTPRGLIQRTLERMRRALPFENFAPVIPPVDHMITTAGKWQMSLRSVQFAKDAPSF